MKDRPGGIDGLKNRSEKCEGPAGGIDRLKNRSGKCKGLGEGARRVKELEWEMRRTGRGGGRRGKEPEWEMRRTGAARGDQRLFERKVFLKNQKHQPNIVEITHLCIMHKVHTSIYIYIYIYIYSFANLLGMHYILIRFTGPNSVQHYLTYFIPHIV